MNRIDLVALQTFVIIARHGSISAAARYLGVNPPSVSHQLKAFEERLGTPLFVRTTRSIALTDAGQGLLDSCGHLLEVVDDALEAARNAERTKAGRLRITMPFRAWQIVVAPKYQTFQLAHPTIELDLTIDEQFTDIISNGFHAGIRLGDYLQDNMVAIRLSDVEQATLVASPNYLERHGTPNTPEDLLKHTCIRHRGISSGRVQAWRFNTAEGEKSVDVNGGIIVNDLRTVIDAARQDFGIGWSLKRGVHDDITEGSLVEVLVGLVAPRPGFHLYFPKSLKKSAVLRAFVDHFR